MKKILFYLSLFIFLSCSNQEQNPDNNSSSLLVSKMITSGPISTGVINNTVNNFEYSGFKILKILRDDNSKVIVFTYSGDLITNEAITGFSNGVPYVINITFSYDNSNRLILYSDGSFKIEYTYLSDNIVSAKSYEINNTSGQFEETGAGNILTLNADNEIVQDAANGIIKSYFYDSRNNPFKNIIGWDKLNILNKEGIIHNILNISQNNGQSFKEYYYTYNDLNYPITRQGTGNTIKYFYD